MITRVDVRSSNREGRVVVEVEVACRRYLSNQESEVRSGLPGRCFRRLAAAPTSHYQLEGGVDLSFESVLRHQIKVQLRGHFDEVSEWPTCLPHSIIVGLSSVAFQQSPGDDVETGGYGAVLVSGGVLVAPAGPGRPCALLRHPKANRRPRRRGPLQSQPGSVQLFASPPSRDATLTRMK